MTSYPVPGVGAFEFAAFYEANVQKVVGGAEYILWEFDRLHWIVPSRNEGSYLLNAVVSRDSTV